MKGPSYEVSQRESVDDFVSIVCQDGDLELDLNKVKFALINHKYVHGQVAAATRGSPG